MAFDEYTGYLEQHKSSAQVIYIIHSSGKFKMQSLRESQHISKTSLSGEKNRAHKQLLKVQKKIVEEGEGTKCEHLPDLNLKAKTQT